MWVCVRERERVREWVSGWVGEIRKSAEKRKWGSEGGESGRESG